MQQSQAIFQADNLTTFWNRQEHVTTGMDIPQQGSPQPENIRKRTVSQVGARLPEEPQRGSELKVGRWRNQECWGWLGLLILLLSPFTHGQESISSCGT